VKNATGISCAASTCTYATCNSGYSEKDSNTANGCELNCGGAGQVCCPTMPYCVPGQLCETTGDGRCH
jgi:hypothetical protein